MNIFAYCLIVLLVISLISKPLEVGNTSTRTPKKVACDVFWHILILAYLLLCVVG